ncbi:flippase [Fusobacterium necrophorum]|uniref:Polysaccharide biosynthesis protein C-terminal domain-containing protein n=1 Tax=Fusobacterium necrophorum DJ-2 TaxID=1441737 RepID=A0AB73C1S7_9FUSO|nr:flippase [Fusobacterium necrophorum]KDE62036.1 hypothetical protein FUSO5_10315 [Fusobacterium necrophorum BFTR-1]KDE62226.1 hypothetical protein FUSO4_10740 [Fusobacterium necrophorum DJ-1]KDE71246.1 hypothetical protein FUSO8_08165 [Fusobacterium necrophorum DJ-2]
MKVSSIKLNFILNTIRLCMGAFFLLITTPYISRILGAQNLGKVDYATSIINYFILFTALGIPAYGIREIARIRDSIFERTKLVLELGIILFVNTVIGFFILLFLINTIPILKGSKTLILIMSSWVLFNNIGLEWFYQGMENQLYITIRFIVIRIIVIILMFLWVKTPEDFYKYAFILVLMNSGSNILNLINIWKYLSFKGIKWDILNLKKHIRSILIIFIGTLSISIYLQLDVVMLGNIGSEYVAYYTVPNKLLRLVLVLITAFGNVLLPRISNCIQKKDKENYKRYTNLSLKYILLLSIPSMVGIFFLADSIIFVMAGVNFTISILTMRILCIILFVVGIGYFLGYQILYPHGLEKYYTLSVTIAAITNFVFNYIMIPKLKQNGAALGTVLAEIIGVLIMLYFTKEYLKEISFYKKENLKYFFAAIFMGCFICGIRFLNLGIFTRLLLSIIVGFITYFGSLFMMKEILVITIISNIITRILKRREA